MDALMAQDGSMHGTDRCDAKLLMWRSPLSFLLDVI